MNGISRLSQAILLDRFAGGNRRELQKDPRFAFVGSCGLIEASLRRVKEIDSYPFRLMSDFAMKVIELFIEHKATAFACEECESRYGFNSKEYRAAHGRSKAAREAFCRKNNSLHEELKIKIEAQMAAGADSDDEYEEMLLGIAERDAAFDARRAEDDLRWAEIKRQWNRGNVIGEERAGVEGGLGLTTGADDEGLISPMISEERELKEELPEPELSGNSLLVRGPSFVEEERSVFFEESTLEEVDDFERRAGCPLPLQEESPPAVNLVPVTVEASEQREGRRTAREAFAVLVEKSLNPPPPRQYGSPPQSPTEERHAARGVFASLLRKFSCLIDGLKRLGARLKALLCFHS